MARRRTRNDTRMARITLTQLPSDMLYCISVRLFLLDRVKMGVIVNFASTCRQLRLSRPPAYAGNVVPGNVERVILGSSTYRFVEAHVQSVSLLTKISSGFKKLDHLVIVDRLTLRAADLMKHTPFSGRLTTLEVALNINIVSLNFLATYTHLMYLGIAGLPFLCDLSALLHCKLQRLAIVDSTVKDLSFLSQLRMLKRFNLERCCNVPDISYLRHLTALEWLSIHHCPRITDISCLVECNRLSYFVMTGFAGNVPPSLYNTVDEIHVYDAEYNNLLHA
jgi:hypothetical protein